jgi:acetyl esterase/lipase
MTDVLAKRSLIAAALCLASTVAAPVLAQQPSAADDLVRYDVMPQYADSTIRRFTEANYVVFARTVKPDAPLLLFLPGTGGRPQNASDFADVAARQGYRVIGLEYTDTPAVSQICPRDRDPDCSEKVRRKRIYGEDETRLIDDDANESIVHRLVSLLRALGRDHPADGWSRYLAGDAPAWSRIAVSGLSQGAGMVAYIAQRTEVARVVLFSSPWDSYGPRRALAPWLTRGVGATPAERWFAVYHVREPTAGLITNAYRALGIPAQQIRVFTLDPASSAPGAYHPSVVGNNATPRSADGTPAYLESWRYLLGDAH